MDIQPTLTCYKVTISSWILPQNAEACRLVSRDEGTHVSMTRYLPRGKPPLALNGWVMYDNLNEQRIIVLTESIVIH
jgi:hypothetical protein